MAKSLSLIAIILLCYFSYLQAQLPLCDRTCGKITFHYPFTIYGRNCRGLPGFEIHCSIVAKKPHLEKANTPYLLGNNPYSMEIVDFSYNNISVVSNELFALPCSPQPPYKNFEISKPFHFLISDNNKFVTVGCNTMANIQLFDVYSNNPFNSWMGLSCQNFSTAIRSPNKRLICKKNGCNYLPLRAGFYKFNLSAEFYDYAYGLDFSRSCNNSGSSVVDENSWQKIQKSETTHFLDAMYPISLDWAIPSSDSCSVIKNKGSWECAEEAECEDLYFGYVCKCREGYKGDGYINGMGCKASCSIGKNSSSYICDPDAKCEDQYFPMNKDVYMGYVCSCPEGSEGDGYKKGTIYKKGMTYKKGTGCRVIDKTRNDACSFGPLCKSLALSVLTGASAAFVVALIGGGVVLWALKRRNQKLAKQRNFDRNGGAQLQRLLSSRGVESTRLFSLDEIDKATNSFSQSLVLGTGGYGTVYKGTMNDGTIVAVKKSKEIDSKEINQFINEVVILSQINHRNVVKLLGCCLETPVPLLVYEYISNGTLFELLHGEKYEDHPLVWEDRLRIATETAEALSYLHSATSMPVVHRDVKSSNILLDDAYNPKVADFGVSRLVPMGQTHVTTVVQGTMGYLDPEYFQTVQLTEKSDVYSFGVVLVELLTGLKPVSYERMKNQSNLAIFFLSTLKSNGLIGIIAPRLNAEENRNMESMRRVANLAKECLTVEGEKRPAMKELVHHLLYIRNGTRNHPWLDVDAVQNEEELISIIAADAEQRDETKGNRATADKSYCSSVPFSIERFREGNSGR